ncbi:MAG: hypothetical protein H6R13_122 [Proteobacteria bacterium]|nr:hypothetical protein [Pseudomonadota bacterium]
MPKRLISPCARCLLTIQSFIMSGRFAFPSASAWRLGGRDLSQAKKRQDSDDDNDQSDEVNNVVHLRFLSRMEVGNSCSPPDFTLLRSAVTLCTPARIKPAGQSCLSSAVPCGRWFFPDKMTSASLVFSSEHSNKQKNARNGLAVRGKVLRVPKQRRGTGHPESSWFI